jgi:hypothetical protein
MAYNTYPLGQLVRIQAVFKDENDAFVDPATITLSVEVADSTGDTVVNTGGLTNSSTGTWHFDYSTDSTGLHEYRWTSTVPQTAGQAYFVVERNRIVSP